MKKKKKKKITSSMRVKKSNLQNKSRNEENLTYSFRVYKENRSVQVLRQTRHFKLKRVYIMKIFHA